MGGNNPGKVFLCQEKNLDVRGERDEGAAGFTRRAGGRAGVLETSGDAARDTAM